MDNARPRVTRGMLHRIRPATPRAAHRRDTDNQIARAAAATLPALRLQRVRAGYQS